MVKFLKFLQIEIKISKMVISSSDERWLEYNAKPNPTSYKGYSLKDTIKTRPGIAKLTLSNGKREVEGVGSSIEDAFSNAFDIIDSFDN